jgi:hypothetical protein
MGVMAMAKQPKTSSRTRVAQLVAEAVAVTCPYCGEPQPNKDGSEMWVKEDFTVDTEVPRKCVSCDETMRIFGGSNAKF